MIRREMGRGRRIGMTLTELLIVITIIATLIGLLLPALNAAIVLANISQARHDLMQIELALNQYMAFMEAVPPTRRYTTSSNYDLDYCLPEELWTNGYLDGPPADPFQRLRNDPFIEPERSLARGYRYKALGGLSTNGGAVSGMVSFSVPADFPESTGTKTTYSAADWYTAPVRIVVWSAGPEGPPVRNSYSADSPAVNAEDPATWYPEKWNGIICRYYTGKDWRYSY